MNRSEMYDTEQIDLFDVLWQFKDILAAIGALELDLSGQTTTMVTGFTPTPTGPASLSINLTSGRIYQQSVMDSAAYGPLPADSTIVQQQGAAPAQSITLSTAGLSSGQSMWALVQAQFSQVDVIRTGDPTGGVLNYNNVANPQQWWQGPNNDGSSQPTERKATVSIQVIYGTPASSGSEVPPNPTNGWVPLFLVDLAFAQTTITSGQILVAGPSVGANVPNNYPGAPFLAGLLNQHHKGTAGQAPQIDLTAEVKNLLPLKNLPASNSTTGGIFTGRIGSGNPNGNQAGNYNVNGALDLYWDNVNNILYACTVTGTASTAVWTAVTGASTSIFAGGTATGTVNAQVVASTTPTGFAKTPGQVVTFTGLNNTGSATLNIDGTGASTVQKNTGGGNVNLTGGEMNGFVTALWTGTIYLLQPGLLGQLATLNIGQWLKNDGSGNLTLNVDASLQDNGSGKLQVAPSSLPPSGALMPYAGSTAPAGWLLAQGQAVSRSTYAALFAACSIAYGAGDGVSTFNLPDLRGRVPAGADGGVNRLTAATMSSQSAGGTGGGETETLTVAQLPTGIPLSITGTASVTSNNLGGLGIVLTNGPSSSPSGGASVSGSTPGGFIAEMTSSGSITASGTANGSSVAHPNVQPTLEVGGYIIKT